MKHHLEVLKVLVLEVSEKVNGVFEAVDMLVAMEVLVSVEVLVAVEMLEYMKQRFKWISRR